MKPARLYRQQRIHYWVGASVFLHCLIVVILPFVAERMAAFRNLDPSFDLLERTELELYYGYANQVLQGSVPYRDFPIEYPILALGVFLLPALFAWTFSSYVVLFFIQILAVDAAIVYMIARVTVAREGIGRVPERLIWYTMFLVALGPVPFTRFDLVPAALCLCAALAWGSGRARLGGILAGVGAWTKLFPIFVAVPAAVIEWRKRRFTGLAALGLSLLGGFVLWAAISGRSLSVFFGYHAGRSLEIESTYAGALLLLGKLASWDMGWRFSHGAVELVAPGADVFARLAPLFLVALLVFVAWRTAAGRLSMMRASTACVTAFLITSKVLSIQYLVWLLPLIAVLEDDERNRIRKLYLAAAFVTSALYPWSFLGLVRFAPFSIGLLIFRNALLICLFVLLCGERAEQNRLGNLEPESSCANT